MFLFFDKSNIFHGYAKIKKNVFEKRRFNYQMQLFIKENNLYLCSVVICLMIFKKC